MPAPLVKGIIVTASVLVAAGVAVYQSPQFQEWVATSRRKIALALHNLGDEIQPGDHILREDISMTEEIGQHAEERRRIARADIIKRGILLESRRKARGPHELDSFDTLVDNDGKLRASTDDHDINAVGASTGFDIGSQSYRRGEASSMGRDLLPVDIPSGTTSNHPSESVIQLTPTSSAPGEILFDPFSDSPVRAQSPMSTSASSHTEGSQVYYAHPQSGSNVTQQQDLLTDLDDFAQGNQFQHPVSSAPSTAGSFSHVGDFDGSSDGTLSDLDARSVGGIATPASWSEVGSEISNEDAGHHQLL
ncbi:hypothetical protein N7448_007906 [Penicillium atrosanguineum]|uniref:Uncharacterized protein n=1 Tax=Penicillium atrosanguineum TaxID=1132637 RepID=A0A9W9UEJ8_9EURO|nr:uncharacterized protein N7443_001072 [Penicillium atrosanguineum]KAJ5127127.1 hypothetical protein N7448_007906 [Penicillium atrosanguineum]KAJ5147333.1 hypothetical protein N7526_000685 [Penicillium atrosanguineum]KAJ5314188.1 hypothetical protein N7443_001072 [Penicillium atrosanguineum]KAJ5331355.1 hypothetical protein N7476_001138 [Penicillium atrosanguineum]